MCILIAKYYEKNGWIGIKNRDRNYIPEISFKKEYKNGLEIMYFCDNITQYSEGFNSNGISVLSASLMVRDDEKEIHRKFEQPSLDGLRIKQSLTYSDINDTVQYLIDEKLTGHTIIFNKDQCFLLEGAWVKGGYKKKNFEYHVRELSKDESIARTNHGILLSWAGYQYGETESQDISRLSSESRKNLAEHIIDRAETPDDILDLLTVDYTNNGQMNPLRTSIDNKKMRTTSQTLIVPKDLIMYVRPVQSSITYNFWELNDKNSKTWVEILSNRILHCGNNSEATVLKQLEHRL